MDRQRLRSKILTAIDNAAPMELNGDIWELVHGEEASHLDLPSLKDAPDTYRVELDVEPAALPIYCVPASSPEALSIVLKEYLVINRERLSSADRNQEIQHEAEHGEAAMLLGAKSVAYYLELHKSEDGDMLGWRLVHCAQGLVTTKLGLAILDVYPQEPSEGDLQQLKLLGYHSIEEVTKLAIQHSLPIPLSASAV